MTVGKKKRTDNETPTLRLKKKHWHADKKQETNHMKWECRKKGLILWNKFLKRKSTTKEISLYFTLVQNSVNTYPQNEFFTREGPQKMGLSLRLEDTQFIPDTTSCCDSIVFDFSDSGAYKTTDRQIQTDSWIANDQAMSCFKFIPHSFVFTFFAALFCIVWWVSLW